MSNRRDDAYPGPRPAPADGPSLPDNRRAGLARVRRGTGSAGSAALLATIAVSLLLSTLPGCTAARCTGIGAFGSLGPEVNSPYDDYAPALLDTATLTFTSSRILPGTGGLQEQYRSIRTAHHFYFSMRLTASWDSAQPYTLILGQEKLEAATLAFAPPGSPFNTVAYVSACGGESSVGGCDLYAVTGGATPSLVNLGREINSKDWDGQPYVTPDGARLYFASDRPGGFGRSDIWIADRQSGGTWGAPYNAGRAVNSEEDELSPFFDTSTGRLYFAATVPERGRDLFMLASGAEARQALPSPLNSDADEFTPFLMHGMLYFASNRDGGCGGYDLYGFLFE